MIIVQVYSIYVKHGSWQDEKFTHKDMVCLLEERFVNMKKKKKNVPKFLCLSEGY